jgi:hypothetical protein
MPMTHNAVGFSEVGAESLNTGFLHPLLWSWHVVVQVHIPLFSERFTAINAGSRQCG